jgi:hypothetical protein
MSVDDEGLVLRPHDPYLLPDEHELEHEIIRPRWWYAQQLRLAGASWDECAKALGYESGESTRNAVKSAKRRRSKEEMEDILDIELERLDTLQLAHWRMATVGQDAKAAALVLQIMNMRMKLLGLEKKPNEAQQVTTNAAFFIGGDSKNYVEQLQQAREMVFNKPKEINE